jgi:hypothetical protein
LNSQRSSREEHVDHVVAGEIDGTVEPQPALRVFEESHDPGDGLRRRGRQRGEHLPQRQVVVVEPGKPVSPAAAPGVAAGRRRRLASRVVRRHGCTFSLP